MRIVSDTYKELMKIESNNIKHQYTIRNITRELDLTDLLTNTSFNISRFLRTAEGNISPSTLNLILEANANAPSDVLIKDFHRRYKDFPRMRWNELLTLENVDEYLVKNGDIITIKDTFNNETLMIFKGVVRNIVKTDTSLGRTIELSVDDNTIKGYEKLFIEDISYENFYISNNTDKAKSLLHIIATKYLGFEDNELEIADIKINNEYVKIPLVNIKKGTKVMEELSEIVRSVYGNIYTTNTGKLKINSVFDKSYIHKVDITLGDKKGNYPILSFIETSEIIAKNNKVEVNYTNTVAQNKQTVFALAGQNAVQSEDDAKIVVRANTTGKEYWKIDIKDVIELDKVPRIVAYTLNGTTKTNITYSTYELDINSSGGKLKLNNTTNKDIFIKEFKLQGRPILTFNNNTVSYTEIRNLKQEDMSIKTVGYKYIMSKEQATEMAKHTYYNECRDYNTIKLRANNMPFLELEDVIKLDFKKYKGNYQIIAIDQANDYMELVLKLYRDYEANSENFITEQTNYANEEYLRSRANIEKEQDKIKSGLYEYNKNNTTIIRDLVDVNKYNIVAYINEIPLNVVNAVKTICEVVKQDNGFYIKVGVVDRHNNILATGKAIWVATRIGG